MRFFTSPGRRKASSGLSTLWGIALLLPSLGLAEPTAGDYYVHSLPGAPDGPLLKMHAGLVLMECIFWILLI